MRCFLSKIFPGGTIGSHAEPTDPTYKLVTFQKVNTHHHVIRKQFWCTKRGGIGIADMSVHHWSLLTNNMISYSITLRGIKNVAQ